MIEVGNDTGGKYTLKSAIYQLALAATTECGDAYDLIGKLFSQIPDRLLDPDDFKMALGCGWPAGIAKLKFHMGKISEPKIPYSGLLKEVRIGLRARVWLLDSAKWTILA